MLSLYGLCAMKLTIFIYISFPLLLPSFHYYAIAYVRESSIVSGKNYGNSSWMNERKKKRNEKEEEKKFRKIRTFQLVHCNCIENLDRNVWTFPNIHLAKVRQQERQIDSHHFSRFVFFSHSFHFLMKFFATTSNSASALTIKRDGKAFYLIRKKRNSKFEIYKLISKLKTNEINENENPKRILEHKIGEEKIQKINIEKRIDSRQFLTSIRSSSLMWLKGNKFLWFRYPYIFFSFPCYFFFFSCLPAFILLSSAIGRRNWFPFIQWERLSFLWMFFLCWFWYFHIEKFPYVQCWIGIRCDVCCMLYISICFFIVVDCRFDVHIFFLSFSLRSVLCCFVFLLFNMFSFSKSE